MYANEFATDKISENAQESLRKVKEECDGKDPFPNIQKRKKIKNSYTYVRNLMTWDEADEYCKKDNKQLFSLLSDLDNESLLNLTQSREEDRGYDYWMGAHKSKGRDQWRWSDESALEYGNWASVFEKDRSSDKAGQCALLVEDGKWLAKPCYNRNRFLCKEVLKEVVW